MKIYTEHENIANLLQNELFQKIRMKFYFDAWLCSSPPLTPDVHTGACRYSDSGWSFTHSGRLTR